MREAITEKPQKRLDEKRQGTYGVKPVA